MNKQQTLDAAKAAVADRGLNYGTPKTNFRRIANRWMVHFVNRYGQTVEIDEADVAMMMNDIKLARLENQPDHSDSWIDIAGYAACGADLFDEKPSVLDPIEVTTFGPLDQYRVDALAKDVAEAIVKEHRKSVDSMSDV